MGKYFRVIYLCMVSVITLIMLVVGLVMLNGSIAAYCYPVIDTYYDDYMYEDDVILVNNMQIEEEYKTEMKAREKIAKRESIKEIFKSAALVVCSAPLYIVHARALKKESEEEV